MDLIAACFVGFLLGAVLVATLCRATTERSLRRFEAAQQLAAECEAALREARQHMDQVQKGRESHEQKCSDLLKRL
jgi:septal ring factor EnvC (AmiA/AmiB activator)